MSKFPACHARHARRQRCHRICPDVQWNRNFVFEFRLTLFVRSGITPPAFTGSAVRITSDTFAPVTAIATASPVSFVVDATSARDLSKTKGAKPRCHRHAPSTQAVPARDSIRAEQRTTSIGPCHVAIVSVLLRAGVAMASLRPRCDGVAAGSCGGRH